MQVSYPEIKNAKNPGIQPTYWFDTFLESYLLKTYWKQVKSVGFHWASCVWFYFNNIIGKL